MTDTPTTTSYIRGPEGFGEFATLLTLGHEVQVESPEMTDLPAGIPVAAITRFVDLGEGEDVDPDPLRVDVFLVTQSGVIHTPQGCSWATLVMADEDPGLILNALRHIHARIVAALRSDTPRAGQHAAEQACLVGTDASRWPAQESV